VSPDPGVAGNFGMLSIRIELGVQQYLSFGLVQTQRHTLFSSSPNDTTLLELDFLPRELVEMPNFEPPFLENDT